MNPKKNIMRILISKLARMSLGMPILLLIGCGSSDNGVTTALKGIRESQGPWKTIKREAEGESITLNREGEFLLQRKVSGIERSLKGKLPESMNKKAIKFADEIAASDFSASSSCAGYSEISIQGNQQRRIFIKVGSGITEEVLNDDFMKRTICLKGSPKSALRLDSLLKTLSSEIREF